MSEPIDTYSTALAAHTATLVHAAIIDVAFERGRDLPDRRVSSAGGAVYDCEMVSVSILSLSEGLAGEVGVWNPMCDPPINLSLELAIVRCANEKPAGVKGNLPPEPEWITADLVSADADADILLAAARQLGFRDIQVTFNGPAGGMISTVLAGAVSPL
jgi:hypothetical protein